METVVMATRIEAPLEYVWKFCGNFGDTTLSRGYVERVEVAGSGVGATRTYHLHKSIGDGYVIERLDRLDERDHVLEYSMVDNGPVPWTGYTGRITVTPAGPQACAVMIRTSFMPVGVDGAEMAALSRSNIAKYFDNLRVAAAEAFAASR